MSALEVSALGCQVEAGHSVVAFQGHVGPGLEEVLDDFRPSLDARQHQGRVLLVVEGVELGPGLDQDVGGEGVTLGGGHVEGGSALGFVETLVHRVAQLDQLEELHVVAGLDGDVHVAGGVPENEMMCKVCLESRTQS